MYNSWSLSMNNRLTYRLVTLGVFLITLIVSIGIYTSRPNAFALPAASTTPPPFINSEVLQNWLPTSSYKYTLARINDFIRTNNTAASYMTIKDTVNTQSGEYVFKLAFEPQDQVHDVIVLVDSFGSIISTSVTIDGQQQGNEVPTQSQNTQNVLTQFSGIDGLINSGLSSFQANLLEQSLQKFAPTAQVISVDTSTITTPPPDPNDTSIAVMKFDVEIDSKKYNAKLECPSLTSAELILTDSKTQKQAFDSGLVTS